MVFFFNECLSSSSAQIISKTTQSRHFAPFEWKQLAVANYKFNKKPIKSNKQKNINT